MEKLFELARQDILCNTSYPIKAQYFSKYRAQEGSGLFDGTADMSVYIHIPFCKSLCRFCEYTRYPCGDEKAERHYLDILSKQIYTFLVKHKISKLYGCDIGGGTPTSLGEHNFAKLMELASCLLEKGEKAHGFEASIEFDLSSISESKIALMQAAGFKRASTGIQVFDKSFMAANNRTSHSLQRLMEARSLLHQHGISKMNVDVMYGLPNQTDAQCRATAAAISVLRPEQVTFLRDPLQYERAE